MTALSRRGEVPTGQVLYPIQLRLRRLDGMSGNSDLREHLKFRGQASTLQIGLPSHEQRAEWHAGFISIGAGGDSWTQSQ